MRDGAVHVACVYVFVQVAMKVLSLKPGHPNPNPNPGPNPNPDPGPGPDPYQGRLARAAGASTAVPMDERVAPVRAQRV